jgi:hypothetical protein
MTKQEAIAALDRIGVPKSELSFVESSDESEDGSIDFWLNDTNGNEHLCCAQVDPYSGHVVSWNAFAKGKDGYTSVGWFYDSLEQLCEGVNKIQTDE